MNRICANPVFAVAGCLTLLAWIATPAAGQANGSAGGPPVLEAVRLAGRNVQIDGRLDEAVWAAADVASGFRQFEPHPGMPGSQRTEARLLYDDEALYVAIRAFDTSPDSVVAQQTRRDAESYSDWVGVMIDSYLDRRTAFQFSVNPAGVKLDRRWHDDDVEDPTWDAVWDVAVQADGEGWAAEFRIPLSQLRFRGTEVQQWGINFHRNIARLGEIDVWAPTSPRDGAVVSRFGLLTGLRDLGSGHRVEILPYLGMRVQDPLGAAAPSRSAETFAAGGLDLKYGVTNDLTLDVTINPDFGQVEADPAHVNLTAFETLYPERRPFFLESANLFDLRISLSDDEEETETLFYSRRIGRQPRGVESGAGRFSASTSQTTILGATKLSGRKAGGWSIGLLTAVTAEERAESPLPGEPGVVVEPLTSYSAGRVQRDLREGRTAIGVLGTLVVRDRGTARSLELHDAAWTAGVDFRHRFARDRFQADGFLVASHVRGSEAALTRTQRSATHMYQRPDADHVELDPGRTSLSGATARLRLSKIAGGPWRGSVGFQMRSPGFEVNDIGYQRYADYRTGYAEIGFERSSPQGPFRSWELYSTAWTTYTTGGERYERVANVRGEATFRNLWGAYAGVEHDQGGFSPWQLRGGPALRREAETQAWAGLYTDERRRARLDLRLSGAIRPVSDSRRIEIEPGLSWRVSESFTLSGGPFFIRRIEDQQWLGTTEGPAADYLFGRLDQRTAGFTFRADHAFTPTLTLQLYAQPYVSAGRYETFQRVLDPRAAAWSDRFAQIDVVRLPDGRLQGDRDGDGIAEAFESPEFNYRQFRCNAVLRWEFRPGSTMYLVWSQGRSDLVADGRFRLGGSLRDLFTANPEDVLMIKVSYWMNR